MDLREFISVVMLVSGCFFIIVASIGILRFPDFFSRIHPAGKSDTLGQGLILSGLIVHEGFTLVSIKLAIIVIFLLNANPLSTHALANAALLAGLRPWKKGEPRR